MARMTFGGCQELMDELFREAERVDRKADEMLDAGSEIMVQAWKDEIEAEKLVDTGSMRDNVRASKNRKRGDGRTADIYPRGKDKHGTRNAEKAFVLHYGTSRIKATRFVDKAENRGGAAAEAAMEAVWEQD